MKKLLLFAFLLITFHLPAQTIFEKINPFEFVTSTDKIKTDVVTRDVVNRYTLLRFNQLKSDPDFLELTIPDEHDHALDLLLYKIEISPSVVVSNGTVVPIQKIIHYRGVINHRSNSSAAITFFGNEIMGLIITNEGNYIIGKIKDSELHILYNDKDLKIKNDFECVALPVPVRNKNNSSVSSVATTKCLNWYWETDYDLYLNKGSVTNVNAYMQGIFNQVALFYANDGITIHLQTLFIWNTADPFTGPSSGNFLDQFDSVRTSFSGDLAHLIGLGQQGGVAWVGGLCSPATYRHAFSDINPTYSNVPVYSWTVDVLAHEEGHLFGSSHTHACVWNGNNTAIDNCGPTAGYGYEGSCTGAPTPVNGGTIMSYCHLIASVGKNFSLGFGPQPKALIINNINNAACLSVSCSCSPPAAPSVISGLTTVFKGQMNVLYSVLPVAGVTAYNWFLPPGVIGFSLTNSILLNFLTIYAGGPICTNAMNTCGTGISTCMNVAVNISGEPTPVIPIITEDHQYKLFPNPAKADFNITWEFPYHENTEVRVFDISGKEIVNSSIIPETSNYTLSTTGWESGIYYLKINNQAKMLVLSK